MEMDSIIFRLRLETSLLSGQVNSDGDDCTLTVKRRLIWINDLEAATHFYKTFDVTRTMSLYMTLRVRYEVSTNILT
jgi:nitrate reductase assembly molybdenum cofactor insertion protein NarJ